MRTTTSEAQRKANLPPHRVKMFGQVCCTEVLYEMLKDYLRKIIPKDTEPFKIENFASFPFDYIV